MVNYSNPLMRDETWRRWKGGQKLADDLRNFYTSKRVFDRLGQQVPLASGAGAAAAAGATGMTRGQFKRDLLRKMLVGGSGNRMGVSPAGRGMLFDKMFGPRDDGTNVDQVRQSGATLPKR